MNIIPWLKFTLEADNHFVEWWHTKVYINVQRMLNFPWSLALHLGTTLFIAHIPQATCLDHPNSLYYHNIALIETNNLNSWPNNRIYGGNDARKAYQLNLYPILNYDNCSFQSSIWRFWCPYFNKVPHLTICTICSTNLNAFGLFHEVMWWSIKAFSFNFWNFSWNSILWLMNISTKMPNLLNRLSINAYVAPSLLWFSNGTNTNHLNKCSIITKTYQLSCIVKLSGPTKSKFRKYLTPIMGNIWLYMKCMCIEWYLNSITHHTSWNTLLNM